MGLENLDIIAQIDDDDDTLLCGGFFRLIKYDNKLYWVLLCGLKSKDAPIPHVKFKKRKCTFQTLETGRWGCEFQEGDLDGN